MGLPCFSMMNHLHRKVILMKWWKEGLHAQATTQKKFQEDLLVRLIHVKYDHSYFLTESDLSNTCITEEKESGVQWGKGSGVQPGLVNKLHQSNVVLNLDQVKSLEANTRMQSDSELFWELRITAFSYHERSVP